MISSNFSQPSGDRSAISGAVTEIVYTIAEGGNTHAYSVNTTTAALQEQPGSPFDLGRIDSSSAGTPVIVGATPKGAFLLIEKRHVGTIAASIYIASADANGIPIFPATDSRSYAHAGESLISPSGKFVYVHEFDQLNTIHVYLLDANGRLAETGSVQLGEASPPGPMYTFKTITANSNTLILRSYASHTCTSVAFYRLPIDQQTGIPAFPASAAWSFGICSGTPYSFDFSELLAVDSTDPNFEHVLPAPVMTAYPFDGVSYIAGAKCDSSVKPLCQSLDFVIPPRSSFIVIRDTGGIWHSLDKSLNETGSTVALPNDGYLYSSADGRLLLLLRNNENFACCGDVHMALFEPATGTFKAVAGTIPGGFYTWSAISLEP